MADFHAATTVHAAPDALFDYLSDVGNLPRYFARMTSATPGQGEEVHTTAEMPDGTQVEGDAWFQVDRDTRHLAWGSEGPNNYHGWLQVADAADGSQVEVRLHTDRVPEGDSEVQDGLAITLANIKQLVEQQYAIT